MARWVAKQWATQQRARGHATEPRAGGMGVEATQKRTTPLTWWGRLQAEMGQRRQNNGCQEGEAGEQTTEPDPERAGWRSADGGGSTGPHIQQRRGTATAVRLTRRHPGRGSGATAVAAEIAWTTEQRQPPGHRRDSHGAVATGADDAQDVARTGATTTNQTKARGNSEEFEEKSRAASGAARATNSAAKRRG